MSEQLEIGQHPVQRRERSFSSRYLDPIDVVSELLPGTAMALSFTLGGSLLVRGGDDATRKMLLSVLGCNIAWGIIDSTTSLMSRMYDLSRKARLLASIRASGGGEGAAAIVADELSEELSGLASPQELDAVYRKIATHLSRLSPERMHLMKEDYYKALITFALMCATTIPAIAPFLLLHDHNVALRVSNVLLLTVLFWSGYRWGRVTCGRPWILGSAALMVGLAMVAVEVLLEP